jgi:predicted N-acyltransferase
LPSKPPDQIDVDPLAVSDIAESSWNGLCDQATGPFADWRFLTALEANGCVGRSTGWQPHPVTCQGSGGQLRAAAPAYFKTHSHGEFVFDWAWARAAVGAGLRWYPKLLVAAPFSPVPGPRLLGANRDSSAAEELVERLEGLVERRPLSSAGVNFCSPGDADVLERAGWLKRFDWQFHWRNRGYRDFDDFLDGLKRKPRKNIRAERRKVVEAGWEFEWKSGRDMNDADLDLIDRCYQSTFALYGNLPALNRGFFADNARAFGEQFLACFARRSDRPLAMAAFWRDKTRLYGRYWGSLDDTRDVHFETCYYQGIDYCIAHGLEWFEPGAQGEHKIRRGFLPQETRSYHYIRHPGLRAGIARYLEAEADALRQYRQQLETLNPFADE